MNRTRSSGGRNDRYHKMLTKSFGIPARLASKAALDNLSRRDERSCDKHIAKATERLRTFYRSEAALAVDSRENKLGYVRQYDSSGKSVFMQRNR